MNEMKTTEKMTQTDRLEAILYQFVSLYERWSEDRQIAAKQGADTAKLVQAFTKQVENFEDLESHVKYEIKASIKDAAVEIQKTIGEESAKIAARETKRAIEELQSAAERAQYILNMYKREVVTTHWKVILGSAFTTIVTCFLLVWFIIPKPTLPLTDQQINYMYDGKLVNLVWPKMSKEERDHFKELADQVVHPERNVNDN